MGATTVSRRRWPWALAGLGAIVTAGAAAGWIVHTAGQAEQHLSNTAKVLPAVRSAWQNGDASQATTALLQVKGDADAAYARTHDPVWAIASAVPLLGQPLDTVRGLTEATRQLTDSALPDLAGAAELAEPEKLLSGPGQVDVQRIAELAAPLKRAADTLDQQQAEVAGLSPSWLPKVAGARMQLLGQLEPVASSTRSAATAAELVPGMLGSGGPRTYFLAFQNPAEARGTGGLLDAFLILKADAGKLTVGRVGSNEQLPKLPAAIPGLSAAYKSLYVSRGAATLWVSSNLSPDFSEVGAAWTAMWKASTGQKVDGAIALDPTALSAVLAATGPVQVDQVGRVDAGSVQKLVMQDQYTREDATVDGGATQRKNAMLGVGTQAIDKVLTGQFDAAKLVDGLVDSGRAGHARIFSQIRNEQRLLEGTDVSGEVPRTRGPFAESVVVNTAGTKLDTYLHTDTKYVVTSCSDKDRLVRVTVTLRNSAPAHGLPPYVTVRADGRKVPAGQNRVNLQVLLTSSAAVTSARLDRSALTLTAPAGQFPKVLHGAKTTFLDQELQVGRPSYGLEIELPPGSTRTLTLDVTEPPSSFAPLMPTQLMATPPTVSSDISACK